MLVKIFVDLLTYTPIVLHGYANFWFLPKPSTFGFLFLIFSQLQALYQTSLGPSVGTDISFFSNEFYPKVEFGVRTKLNRNKE